MTRTFFHSFDPPAASPVSGATVDLEVSEIEDAGIREVLQTPGAAYGAWSILDALLTPTGAGTPFVFREPLGQAREVKVALSGLFGRFVARAYLERYFNLSIFAHLGSRMIDLDRRRQVKITRLSRGDLPDWIACASNLSSLTVAEAKGCHDVGGPAKALDRAWAQARRIDVTARGRKVTVKRIAIATRWGMTAGPADARLSVRDPVEEGEPHTQEEKDALFIGMLRLHIANLIKPLGHAELADALRGLTLQSFPRRLQGETQRARSLLDASAVRDVDKASAAMDGLIGGIVTRAGPLTDTGVEPADQEALSRLNLRPVFVGVEHELIRAAIDAEPQAIRSRLAEKGSPDEFARPDRAGGWIIPLGQERRIIGGT